MPFVRFRSMSFRPSFLATGFGVRFMILSRNLSTGSLFASFGPVPFGWRVRRMEFTVYPIDPTLAAVLSVVAGFNHREINATGQIERESNRIITGPATVGVAVVLVNYVGSPTQYPQWSFSLPCSLPLGDDERYLGVEYKGFTNVGGTVAIDLIPLTPREFARLGRTLQSYLVGDSIL